MSVAVVPAARAMDVRLHLIGEFDLFVGVRNIAVPRGAGRLLAFLAISRRPVQRSRIAGQLWPDVPERRARGNLRSMLWRLGRLPARVVQATDDRLALDAGVQVDLLELLELATSLLGEVDAPELGQLVDLIDASEILPGWEEEWLVVERERFHELRLRALERSCEAMIDRGNPGQAAYACLAAVEAEPFRESAQRLLVRMYLNEGNRAAALRSFLAYRDLVQEELGIEPSDLMADLVAGIQPASARTA